MWNRALQSSEIIGIGNAQGAPLDEQFKQGLIVDWDNYGPDAGCQVVAPSTVAEDQQDEPGRIIEISKEVDRFICIFHSV